MSTPASDAYFAATRAGAKSQTITAEMFAAKAAEDADRMAGVAVPRLAPAEVTVRIFEGVKTVHVSVAWLPQEGLDRFDCGGWSCGPDSARARSLARRLAAAIDAGVAVIPSEPFIDIDGNRGWHSTRRVLGRMMNADLRRLGF